MKKSSDKIGIYLLVITVTMLSLYGCAATGRPNGGPRDKTPPQVDSAQSTPNYTTNFDEKKIEVKFDEFITGKNLITKTIISPPLTYIPKLEVRGKKLTIEINEEEELKENVTYIFNFGDAIQDYHEGNKLENYRFVFSTGPVIDSLGLSGKVVDAYTGKSLQDVSIMLYDDTRDSVVYQNKPFYFVNSDKEGNFKFSNLRADTFKVFALKDGNLNYIYDLESELIGYKNDLIVLSDTFTREINLEVFLESAEPRFLKKGRARNYKVDIIYAAPLEYIPSVKFPEKFELIYQETIKDTLRLWHRSALDSFNLIVQEDTLKFKPFMDSSILNQSIPYSAPGRGVKKEIAANDSIRLTFESPIMSIQDSFIVLSDSSTTIPLQWNISGKTISGIGRWKADSTYNMTILPGAVRDIAGRTNDTINTQVKVNLIEKYGDILLKLKGLDSSYQYRVSLLRGSEEVSWRQVAMKDSIAIEFRTLSPGDYGIQVLEDRNGNGRWDPGNYLNKSFAEKIKSITLEKLRENWELNADFDWQQKE